MAFWILLAVSPVPYFDCTLISIFCVISLANSRATVFEKRIVRVSPFTHGGFPLSNCPHSLIAASISGDRYVSTPKAFSASVLNNIFIFSLNHAIKPIIITYKMTFLRYTFKYSFLHEFTKNRFSFSENLVDIFSMFLPIEENGFIPCRKQIKIILKHLNSILNFSFIHILPTPAPAKSWFWLFHPLNTVIHILVAILG